MVMLLTASSCDTKVEYTHIPWLAQLFALNLPVAAVKNSLCLYTSYTSPQSSPFGNGTPRNALKNSDDFIT